MAQTYQDAYKAFRQQAINDYESFRDKVNKEYAVFMRQAWERYQALPEIPKPKDEPPVPPTPYPKDDKDEPIKDVPQPYEEIIPVVEPEPQPKPVAPIREQPQPEETYFNFSFFQTSCKVRLDESHRFALKDCQMNTLADAWDRLAGRGYHNVIRDCLELRIRHKLCDWAYLLMLQELSDSYFGKGTNESVLLCAYLYCQSGYQMRLGLGNNRLYLLVASKHQIYESGYWEIDGMFYYPFNCQEQSLEICGASFPNEQPLSLLVNESPLFTEHPTDFRTLQSENYSQMQVKVSADESLISNHPIKYTITNITKAAIPIVGYAAFVIYSHYFFHLCGSSCSSSSYVAFCIYGILAITSFKYSLGFTSCALQVASSEHTTLILTAAS